jgi:hypothetical protein
VAPSSGSALVGLSDRADLLGLNAELNVVGRAPRAFPLSAQSCADFTATGVSAEVTDCPDLKIARAKDRTVADAPGHDAVALASITESSGERVQFSARLPTGETKVQIEAESPIRATHRIVLEQSGDALALGDVDGDGTMDVVTSTAGAGKKDTLRIHSLVEGKAKPVANLSLAPVHALALCPFSGKNPLSLVVLAGEEIHTFY